MIAKRGFFKDACGNFLSNLDELYIWERFWYIANALIHSPRLFQHVLFYIKEISFPHNKHDFSLILMLDSIFQLVINRILFSICRSPLQLDETNHVHINKYYLYFDVLECSIYIFEPITYGKSRQWRLCFLYYSKVVRWLVINYIENIRRKLEVVRKSFGSTKFV